MHSGPSCLVCAHDKRESIEGGLLQGKPLASIAREHGISRETIRNHRDRCIPEVLARSRHAEAIRRGDRLVDQAEYLYSRAVKVLERAEAARETSLQLESLPVELREEVEAIAEALAASDLTVLRAIREARPTLELLAKLAGQIREEVTLNLVQAPDYQALRRAILEAVRPYTEAHLALADAMNEFQVERGGDSQPLH